MKYIRPPEFKSVREFTEYYRQVEQNITDLMTKDAGAATSGELNEQLQRTLQAAMSYLSGINKEYTKTELPRAFEEGREGIGKSPELSMSEAASILKKQGYRYSGNALSRYTYIELQSAVKSAGKGFKTRVNRIVEELRGKGKDSVYNVQEAVKKDLEEHGLLTVEYSNGAKQPLSAYAAMAARSARIESANIGAIGRALQSGTDYVKMTTMPQCCKFCGAYQGKIYCISGKDNRFPALFKTVLKSGYALPHPNCRHEFIPWFPEIEAPEDVEKAIEDSRIRYNADGSLKDVRYQRDIEAYAAWQVGNRQLNTEATEYLKMQSYYKGKGTEPPYKSLASFRRARRRDELSPAYKAWKNRKKDEQTYEEWKGIIGKNNLPETLEKFQEMKYNKDEKVRREFDLLRQYKETVETDGVTNIGFKEYQGVMHKATREIIGIKTSTGAQVEQISKHLVDRIIGSEKKKREGVPIKKVVETLQKGEVVKEKTTPGGRSVTYYYDGCEVSFNPDAKRVIQCHPKTRTKK